MALSSIAQPAYGITRGMSTGADAAAQKADPFTLAIPEFTGIVEGTIARKSVMQGWIPVTPVRGTNVLTNYGVGEAQIGVVEPGKIPDGQVSNQDKINLTIDTLVYSRHFLPLLDTFVQNYDMRAKLGDEQGKKIAKFYDQSFLIQAAKIGMAANSKYTKLQGKGHTGGSQVTLGAALDRKDPAKLEKAIIDLLVKFEQKDVDPRMDDLMIVLPPAEYYTMLQAEKFINTEYVTAAGTRIDNQLVLKAYGVPVISTNNLPQTNIATHELGADYTGDFSKLVAAVLAPNALLAGELVPLTSDVFYDKMSKQWVVDSHLSYGVTGSRAEYAGAILQP